MAEAETDEAKRRRILDGARNMFLREGISSLTMDQIASRQGVSKKTLYKYFSSKEELIEAAVEERIQQIAEVVKAALADRSLPFPVRMGRVLGVIGGQLALLGDRLLNDIIYREPHLWEKLDKFRRDHVFGPMSRLLEQGIEDGFVRSDIEPRLVPVLFMAAVSSLVSPSQFLSLTIAPVTIFQTVTRILLGGILTEEGRTQLERAQPPSMTEVEK